jgi:hypothetical protein
MECLDLISGALNCISTCIHHISIWLCKFDPCEKSGIGLSEVSSQCSLMLDTVSLIKIMKILNTIAYTAGMTNACMFCYCFQLKQN